jgi:hypothetical protein
MKRLIAAITLCAQVAFTAPAFSSTPPATEASGQQAVVIPSDWAAPPPPDKALIRRAIKQSFEEEKMIAEAESKAKAIPYRFSASSEPDQDKYEKFEGTFADAKVPGCLSSEGLKRQPTFIFGGLLALPFVAVAAVRGKCN